MNSKLMTRLSLTLALLSIFVQGSVATVNSHDHESTEDSDTDDTSNSEEKAKKKEMFSKCQGHPIEPPKQFVLARQACEEEKNKTGENRGSVVNQCCGVCVWEKMDLLLGEHKKLDSSAVEDLVDAVFTGPLERGRPILKSEWKECKKQIGREDEDDKKCKRFKKYFICIIAAFQKFCTAVAAPKAPKKSGIFLLLGGR